MMKILPIVLLLLMSCSRPSFIIIVYFNDAHDISPVKDSLGERGGVARLKTVIDGVRNDNPNTLVVFGGDLAGGTLFGGMYHGFPMVEAFNQIPLDLANFGQHDFDFGADNTRALVDSSKFEWFTSNLLEPDSSVFYHLPSILIKQAGGLNIGFIGLTDAMNTTTMNDIIQLDLMQAASQAVSALKMTDVIIAVTQTDLKTNEMLLLSCPDIDAILTEERSENRTIISHVGKRPIVSPCGNLGSVARLDICKNKNGLSIKTSAIAVDSMVSDNQNMLSLQKKYQDDLQQKLNTVIATTKVRWDAGVNSHFRCRWAETNIGNLVADAYRDYHNADLAVVNGGGLRANIPAGKITTKDVLALLPFGNKICLVEMTGHAIWNMLEHGVSDVENRGGQFLQISGGRYVYDSNASPGDRIRSVFINHQQIAPRKIYTVALPDYVLFGGNDFDIEADIIVNADEAPIDFDVVCEFVKDKMLENYPGGRICVLGMD